MTFSGVCEGTVTDTRRARLPEIAVTMVNCCHRTFYGLWVRSVGTPVLVASRLAYDL